MKLLLPVNKNLKIRCYLCSEETDHDLLDDAENYIRLCKKCNSPKQAADEDAEKNDDERDYLEYWNNHEIHLDY